MRKPFSIHFIFFRPELISSIKRSANKAIREAAQGGVIGNLDCKAIRLRSDFRMLAKVCSVARHKLLPALLQFLWFLLFVATLLE